MAPLLVAACQGLSTYSIICFTGRPTQIFRDEKKMKSDVIVIAQSHMALL